MLVLSYMYVSKLWVRERSMMMKDQYGREIDYLRDIVTDR